MGDRFAPYAAQGSAALQAFPGQRNACFFACSRSSPRNRTAYLQARKIAGYWRAQLCSLDKCSAIRDRFAGDGLT